MAPASRTEAVAAVTEPLLEDRFDHQPDRLLDDAILDRGNPQRSRPAVALRDLDPLDGLRAIFALPQRRRQLRQIDFCLRRKPIHTLPIHARRAFVGPDLGPGRLQRFGRVHLVYQRVPLAAFDAVAQRRQHALRPYRRFDPGPVSAGRDGLCTLLSLFGTTGAALPWHGLYASTFLPCLPSNEFVLPRPSAAPAHGPRNGTMRALTPRRLAHTDKVSLLALLCCAFRASRPQPRHGPGHHRLIHVDVAGRVLPPRLRLGTADSPHHNAETGSLSCGLLVRLRLLPTPPPAFAQSDDAVAFGYSVA